MRDLKSSPRIRTRSTWSSAVQVAVRTPGGVAAAELGQIGQQADLAEVAAGADVVEHVLAARRRETFTKPMRTR